MKIYRYTIFLFMAASIIPGESRGQTFSRVTDDPVIEISTVSLGASWGDSNGDGFLDLYVSNSPVQPLRTPATNEIYINNGDGTFTQILEGDLATFRSPTQSSTWIDFNGDGRTDLFVNNARPGSAGPANILYKNQGDGTFARVTGGDIDIARLSISSSWADYDRDGDLDLLMSDALSGRNTLLRLDDGENYNIVSGTPFEATGLGSRQGLWFDYDEDGDQDLFFVSFAPPGTTNANLLYRNMIVETGTPSFEPDTLSFLVTDRDVVSVMGASIIDFDTDGDLDVNMTTGFGSLRSPLYLNNGSGLFSAGRFGPLTITFAGKSTGACWGDYDNDGDLDLFMSTNPFLKLTGLKDGFFVNDGTGTFSQRKDVHPAADDSWANGCANGDIDNDGDLDLFVATGNNFTINAGIPLPSPNVLYRNDDGNSKNWINLTLQGTTSNRAGIGARVFARANIGGASRKQVRLVSGNPTGDRGQNSMRVHFGLDDATTIEELTIEWPSGNTDVFSNVAVNQFLTAIEGDNLVSTADEEEAVLPKTVTLSQNYPNPFNPSTTILFSLDRSAVVSLDVFDLLGRKVASLLNSPMAPGDHSVSFNGVDLPSGLYIYRLQTGTRMLSRPMLLQK